MPDNKVNNFLKKLSEQNKSIFDEDVKGSGSTETNEYGLEQNKKDGSPLGTTLVESAEKERRKKERQREKERQEKIEAEKRKKEKEIVEKSEEYKKGLKEIENNSELEPEEKKEKKKAHHNNFKKGVVKDIENSPGLFKDKEEYIDKIDNLIAKQSELSKSGKRRARESLIDFGIETVNEELEETNNKGFYNKAKKFVLSGASMGLQAAKKVNDIAYSLTDDGKEAISKNVILSDEQKQKYDKYKDEIFKVKSFEANETLYQIDDLKKRIEAKMKDPDTGTMERMDLKASYSRLVDREEILEDRQQKDPGMNLENIVDNVVGRHFFSYNDEGDEAAYSILPSFREEFASLYFGNSLLGKTISDRVEDKMQSQGKTLEDATEQDHIDVYNSLPESEKLRTEAEIASSDAESHLEDLGYLYNIERGAGESIAFMGSMYASGGLGSLSRLSKVAKLATATQRLKKSADIVNSIKGVSSVGSKGSKLTKGLAKTMNAGGKIADVTTKSLVQSAMHPTMINMELRQNNTLGFIRDNEGKILAGSGGEAYRNYRTKQLDKREEELKEFVNKIDSKYKSNQQLEEVSGGQIDGMPPEVKKSYNQAKAQLGMIEDNSIVSINEQREMINNADDNVTSSILKGVLKTGTERVAELYSVKLLQGAGKLGFKVIGRDNQIARDLRAVGDSFGNARDFVYRRIGLGRRYKNQEGAIVNDFGTEAFEEYPVELANSLIDTEEFTVDGITNSLNEFKDTAFTYDFAMDILGQTAIMKGAMKGGSTGVQQSALYMDKINQKKIKNLRKKIQKLETEQASPKKIKKEKRKLDNLVASEIDDKAKYSSRLKQGFNIRLSNVTKANMKAKNIERFINKLKDQDVDAEVLDLVKNYDPYSRTIKDNQNKVKELKKKGQLDDAQRLETHLQSNLLESMINSGRYKEFKRSIEKNLGKGKGLEDYQNAYDMLETLKEVEKHYDRFGEGDRSDIGARMFAAQHYGRKLRNQYQKRVTQIENAASKDLIKYIDTKSEAGLSNKDRQMLEDNFTSISNEDNPHEQGSYEYKFVNRAIQLKNQLLQERSGEKTGSDFVEYSNSIDAISNIDLSIRDKDLEYQEVMYPDVEVAYAEDFKDRVLKEFRKNQKKDDAVNGEAMRKAIETVKETKSGKRYNKQVTDKKAASLENTLVSNADVVDKNIKERKANEELIKEIQKKEKEEAKQKNVDKSVKEAAEDLKSLNDTDKDPKQTDEPDPEEKENKTNKIKTIGSNPETSKKESKETKPEDEKQEGAPKVANLGTITKEEKPDSEKTIEDDFDDAIEDEEYDEALDLPDVTDPSEADYNPDDPYSEKMYKVIKNLANLHKESTGENPTFKDVMDMIILLEPESGRLLLERPDGLGTAVQVWKKLNQEFGELKGQPFNKGEVQQVIKTLNAKVKELGSREKAIESYKHEVAKDKSYMVDEPGADENNQVEEKKKSKTQLEKDFEVETSGKNDETDTKPVEGRVPRVGLLGLDYEPGVDKDGNAIKITKNSFQRKYGTTSSFLQIDSRPLLDPNVTDNEYHELEVEIVDESLWGQVPMVDGVKEDGKPKTVNFNQWLAKREKKDPNFRNTVEFKSMVPIYLKKNGKRVGRIHDSGWFNGSRIKSPQETKYSTSNYKKDPVWKKAVDDARERNLQMRLKILNPDNDIKTISYVNNQRPKQTKIKEKEKAMTFNLADPDAYILPIGTPSIQNINKNMKDFYGDSGFENGTKQIINDDELTEMRNSNEGKGHTYALRRVSSRMVNGKKVQTYVLDRVLRKNPNMQEEFRSIESLYKNLKRLKQLEGKNKKTQEEQTEYETLKRFEDKITEYDNTSLEDYIKSLYKLNKDATDRINSRKRKRREGQILEELVGKKGNVKFASDAQKKEAKRRAKEEIKDNRSYDGFTYELALEEVFKSNNPVEAFGKMFVQNTNYEAMSQNRLNGKRSKGFPIFDGTDIKREVDYVDYLKSILSTNIVSNPTRDDGSGNTIVAQPVLEIDDSLPNKVLKEEDAEETNQEEQHEPDKNNFEETKENNGEPITQALREVEVDIENAMGVSLSDYDEYDETINFDKLGGKFKSVVAGLPTSVADDYIEYLVQAIVRKAEFRENISKERYTEMKAVAKNLLNIRNRHITTKSKELLSRLKSADDSNMDESDKYRKERAERALNDIVSMAETSEENFDTLFVKSKERVDKEVDIKEEEDNELLEESEKFEKNYSKSSIEETVKSKATPKIKMLLHGIPKYDRQGNIERGFGGMPKYMTLDEAFNLLLKTVSIGSDPFPDFDSIMEKLDDSEDPSLKKIKEKINSNKTDAQLKNQIVSATSMHSLSSRFIMYQHKEGQATNMDIFDTNSSTLKLSIKSNWSSNLAKSNIYDESGSLNILEARRLINKIEELGVESENKLEKAKEILESIGFEFHPKTWDKMLKEGIKQGNNIVTVDDMISSKGGDKSFTVFDNMVTFLNEAIENPSEYSASGKTVFESIGGFTNKVAELEAYYNPKMTSTVYRDSGKTISTLTPPKYITDMMAKLQSGDKEFIEEVLDYDYSSQNMMLETLLKNEEFKDFIKLHHVSLNAVKDRDKKGKKPKKLVDLGQEDFDLFSMGTFFSRKKAQLSKQGKVRGITTRIADMLVPTMSDKDTSLTMSTVVLDLLASEADSFTTVNNKVELNSKVINILKDNIFLPETRRIISENIRNASVDLKGYNQGRFIYNNISGFNSIQINGMNLPEYIRLYVANSKDKDSDELQKEIEDKLTQSKEVNKFINEFVNHEADKNQKKITNENGGKVNELVDTGYVTEGLNKNPKRKKKVTPSDTTNPDVTKKVALDYTVNNLIFMANYNSLFIGDTAQYFKAKVPKGKEITQLSRTEYKDMVKETGVNLGKRLAELIAPGRKINVPPKQRYYNQLFLEDPVDISENINQLIDWYYPDVADEAKTIAAGLKAKKTQVDNAVSDTTQLDKEIEKDLKELKGMIPNIAGYLELELADAQEYTTVGEHLFIMYQGGKISKSEYERLLKAYQDNNLTSKDKKTVLQPMKPVYTGMHNDPITGIRRMYYIKSSSMPLIPEVTKGTKLDNLRKIMEDQGVQRASYQTANKVGAPITTVSTRGEVTFNPKAVMQLDRNNFRLQQDVPHKSSKMAQDKVALGTQIFKILFGNGVKDIKSQDFDYKGKKVSGEELYKNFKSSFDEIYDSHLEDLYSELGIKKNDDGYYEIGNQNQFKSKLSKLLKKEAESRGYDLKSVEGLDLVKNKDTGEFDFVNPLWLSSESNRYESLLNSIITNRIMQFKMPGNGFIAASENGFNFKEDLAGVDQNNIIYTDKWNGKELQATKTENGKLKNVQVMVESKIKTDDGELLDMFEDYDGKEGKYIRRDDNGVLKLKEDMLDEKVLKLFSFRTPTSGHVSGSSIEIVGFLPPNSGDAMIVPKNFTQQKGLDFDIDKESAYAYNHYIDTDGKVRVYDDNFEKEINKLIESDSSIMNYALKHFYDEFNIGGVIANHDDRVKSYNSKDRGKIYFLAKLKYDAKDNTQEALEEGESMGFSQDSLNKLFDNMDINDDQLIDEIAAELHDKYDKDKVDATVNELVEDFAEGDSYGHIEEFIKKKLSDKTINALKRKKSENDFIETHFSVYDTANEEVQRKINRILSMDFAKKEAERLEEATEKGNKEAIINQYKKEGLTNEQALAEYNKEEEYFNLFSYQYQKDKMDLGATGKQAIGIYSVAVTMNSLIQQEYGNSGASVANTQSTESGKELVSSDRVNFKINLGGQTSYNFSPVMTIDGERETAEVLMEKQNTATDNEKEQILGRVGVTNFTIGVDTYLTLRGFDKGSDGTSISYNFISQPVVKEMERRLNKARSINGEYKDEKGVYGEIAAEIEKSFNIEEKKLSDKKGNIIRKYYVDKSTGQEVSLPEDFSNESLISNIESNNWNSLQQLATLKKFMSIKQQADSTIKPTGVISSNTAGKSMLEANKKIDDSIQIRESALNTNILKGNGKFPSDINTMEEIVNRLINNSPQGRIAVEGLLVHNKLFSNLFPYENPSMKSMIEEIFMISGFDREFTSNEDLEEISNEFKKFLFSSDSIGASVGNADYKRKELMEETSESDSLAKYISDLLDVHRKEESKNKKDPKRKDKDKVYTDYRKGIKAIADNVLTGSGLSYKISKKPDEVSRIVYDNAGSENINEESLYNSLIQLALSKQQLPNRNGKPYDTTMLVKDLISYSFLEGGLQKANEFVKFIPVSLLSSTFFNQNNMSKSLRDIHTQASIGEDITGDFVIQYFQNNPDKAKKAINKPFDVDTKKDTVSIDSEVAGTYGYSRIVRFKDQETGNSKLYMMNPDKTVLSNNGQRILTYDRIPAITTKYISQYNPSEELAADVKDYSETRDERQFDVDSDKTIIRSAINTSDTVEEFYESVKGIAKRRGKSELFEFLLSRINRDLKIEIDSNVLFFASVYMKDTIRINPESISSSSSDRMFDAMLHELQHAANRDGFLKDFTRDKNTREKTIKEDASDLAKEIDAIFKFAYPKVFEAIASKYKNINASDVEAFLDEVKENFGKNPKQRSRTVDLPSYNKLKYTLTKDELTSVYYMLSPDEMFSGLVESQAFREILGNMEYKKGNLLQRLISKFKAYIKEMFPEIKEDSAADAAFTAMFEYIEQNGGKPNTETPKPTKPRDPRPDTDVKQGLDLYTKKEDKPSEDTTVEEDFEVKSELEKSGRVKRVYTIDIQWETIDAKMDVNKLKELSSIADSERNVVPFEKEEDYSDTIRKKYGEWAGAYVYETSSEISEKEGKFLKDNSEFAANFMNDYLGANELADGKTMQQYAQDLIDKGTSYELVDTAQLNLFDDQNINNQIDETIDLPNSPSIKEGVNELFKENPELANIGTPQQYSQYIDSIFPDSKLNQILYHSTDSNKFEKFEESKKGKRDNGYYGSGFYFHPVRTKAYGKNIIPAIVNTVNPKTGDYQDSKNLGESDAFILTKDYYDPTDYGEKGEIKEEVKSIDDAFEYMIPNSEQIEILGSESNLQGFKQWTEENTVNQENSFTFEKTNSGLNISELMSEDDWNNLNQDEKNKIKKCN